MNTAIGTQPIVMGTRDIESELARIWSEVLQIPVESVGLDANFLSLGGDSLLMARVAEEVAFHFFSDRPDHAPGIGEIFSYGTVRTFAGLLVQILANSPVMQAGPRRAD